MSSASPRVMSLSSFEAFSALGQTGLTLASSYTVLAFSTTAAATGILALESCMLKNELIERIPTKAASIFLLLSDLFRPPQLYRLFMGLMVDENRIQI